MKLFSKLVDEYWEEYGDNFDISYEEFKKVCYTPFNFLKDTMSSGILKDIRFKYLGIFEVSASRVKYCKKTLTDNYEKGVISKEKFDKRVKVLDSYG